MKIVTYFLLIFIINSCERRELLPTTAESLIERIYNYKGEKAVLVNVWALWCKPCVEEFPMVVNLVNEWTDLEVIFVSVDFEEELKNVVGFLSEHHPRSVSYYKKQKDDDFINKLNPNWSGSIPYIAIYSKEDGSLVDYWEGKKEKSRFTQSIQKALKP